MTLSPRSVNSHEMAVEAALGRLSRRWARQGFPFDAEMDVVAALLRPMVMLAQADTLEQASQLSESVVAAGPTGFVSRLANAVRSRLAASASAIVTGLRKGTPISTLAATQVSAVRVTAAQTLASSAAGTHDVQLRWHSAPGCTHALCCSLDGVVVPWGVSFPSGAPPLHRNCACRLSVEINPLHGITAAGLVRAGLDPTEMAERITAAADGPGWLCVAAIEGLETPDGRMAERGSLSHRALPLPITWAPTCDDHENDVVVGQVTSFERVGDEVQLRGTWDTSPTATEARRLVDEQVLRWVSMVIDNPRAWEVRANNEACLDETAEVDGECRFTEVVLDADIAKITLVDHPAWPGAVIVPGDAEIPPLTDRGRAAAEVPSAEAVAACAARALPPASWYNVPKFSEQTDVTITDEGRIFGHFAPDVEHISGFGRPPKGDGRDGHGADYSLFHIHGQPTADGAKVPVGLVIGGVGHPNDIPRTLSVAEAQRYYAGPGAVVAGTVRVGEDEFGIWCVGAVNPDLSDDEREQLRTFKFSGDWRREKGAPCWQLVAVASGILVPGYHSRRTSLVAAGSETCLILTASP